MRAVIIEGMASSGKTILARKLEELLDEANIGYLALNENDTLKPVFRDTSLGANLDLVKKLIAKASASSKEVVIFERLYLSHLKRTGKTEADFSDVSKTLAGLRPIIALLTMDEAVIRERIYGAADHREYSWNDRLKEKGVSEEEVLESYRDQQRKFIAIADSIKDLEVKKYDTTSLDFDVIAQDIFSQVIKGIIGGYSQPFLGKLVDVRIDRPIGSAHPEHGYVYPINYGYVPKTKAPDGKEIDAYVLGVDRPLEEFRGRCIAIVRRIEDDDDKLIVCPDGQDYSDAQIRDLTHFQEQWFDSKIVRVRDSSGSRPTTSDSTFW
jgi:inorganic pyrophosphatase